MLLLHRHPLDQFISAIWFTMTISHIRFTIQIAEAVYLTQQQHRAIANHINATPFKGFLLVVCVGIETVIIEKVACDLIKGEYLSMQRVVARIELAGFLSIASSWDLVVD